MGAKVSILNTNPANAASAVKSLKDTNPSYEINTAQCDVSNYASVLSAFESCFSRYGTINIVIVNAGINEEHQPSHQFLTSQPSLSPTSPPPLRALDVNLIGCLYTVYAGLFYIRKGGIGGTILCTSSNAGLPLPFRSRIRSIQARDSGFREKHSSASEKREYHNKRHHAVSRP